MELLVVVFINITGSVNGCLIGGLAVPPAGTKGGAVGRNANGVEAM